MDGRFVAGLWREHLARAVADWVGTGGRPPGLAVVRVGEDPASAVYVRQKATAARAAGFLVEDMVLPEDTSMERVQEVLRDLAARPEIDGLMLQLPVPPPLDADVLLEDIPGEMDVDGLGIHQAGRLATGVPDLPPCTPAGVMELLRAHGVNLSGARALVIGRSRIVGRPMAQMLLHADATVTVAHSRTRDLEALVASADLVVVAAGRSGLIKGAWCSPESVVVDVGIHPRREGGLTGDVDWQGEVPRVQAWTPVPGGVGPMTVAMLLVNTWRAHGRREAHAPLEAPYAS